MTSARTSNSGFGRFLFLLSVAAVAAAIALFVAGYDLLREEFPDVSVLKTHYPVLREKRAGKSTTRVVELKKARPSSWIPLSQVSRPVVGAVVVSEDWAFFEHEGFDPAQIKEAVRQSVEKRRLTRGASTITQQVVKNVFLSHDRTLWRKLKELILAVRLEDQVGKKKILETYLNIVEWGRGIYGIRSAARHYFGKHPSELTPKEAAFLAMLLPSPKRYSQSFRQRELTRYARRTVNSILRKMKQAHFITEEDLEYELSVPLSWEKQAELEVESEEPLDGALTEPEADEEQLEGEPEAEPGKFEDEFSRS